MLSEKSSIRLMLGSTNEWSWVSTHWNAIKHNAEQTSFFHEHTLHVHKKASAKTTTDKFTQTRQIPRINLQRRLQVFPESGTYRMLFSVEVWTMQMNYVLNLLGCTFAMIFTSKCRTATYSTAWDHPLGQLSTFDLGTTTNRPLVRAVSALTVCGVDQDLWCCDRDAQAGRHTKGHRQRTSLPMSFLWTGVNVQSQTSESFKQHRQCSHQQTSQCDTWSQST